MNSSLDFSIENKTLKELISDANMYDAMKHKIAREVRAGEEREKRYELVRIAELNTNIAIMYIYYKNGMLSDMFRLQALYGKAASDKTQIYLINWGDVEQQNKAMSLICKMLSELSVDHIAETEEKTEMYHEITEVIDNSRKSRRPFIINVEFWMLYFRFYEKYHEQ